MKALWIIGGILLLLVLLSLVRVGAVLSFGEELCVRLRLGPAKLTLLPRPPKQDRPKREKKPKKPKKQPPDGEKKTKKKEAPLFGAPGVRSHSRRPVGRRPSGPPG